MLISFRLSNNQLGFQIKNHYKQLTLKERYHIEIHRKEGLSAREIGLKINRSNKTISHELTHCKKDDYCAETAHRVALKIRQAANKHTKVTDKLKDTVRSALLISFTPEQIAGRMKFESLAKTVSTNTIYRLIKKEKWRHMLPRKGKIYKQRQGCEAGARLIPNRVDIDERPAEVDEKNEVGHWEADTMHGQDGYLVTLVERVSKLLIVHPVANKSKKLVTKAIKKMLRPFKSLCKTITFDNGGEFAGHEELKLLTFKSSATTITRH